MASIAASTGGKYRFVGDPLALAALMLDYYGEFKGGLMRNEQLTLNSGANAESSAQVDALSQEVEFVLSAPDTTSLGFSIESPSGAVYSTSDPAHAVSYEGSASAKIFRVRAPETGVWKYAVNNTSANHADFSVSATAESSVVNVTPAVDNANHTYPEKCLITCVVSAGSGVAGAEATAYITKPDGLVSLLPLSDDGDVESHGDQQGNDGIYSAYFTPRANGSYNVRIQVKNTSGHLASNNSELPTAAPVAVAPFTREATFSFNYAGAPPVQEEYLRVDKWNLTLSPKGAAGSISMAGEFNVAQGGLDLLANGLTFAYGTYAPASDTYAAASFTKGRGSKYTYKDRTKSGSFLLNQGGSSRSKFTVASKETTYGTLRGQSPVTVLVGSGGFSNSVTLLDVLKGKAADAGRTGSSFAMNKDFYVTPALFVDSLLISYDSAKPNSGSVTLAGRFPGARFDSFSSFSLDLGWTSLTVPAQGWTSSRNKNSQFMYQGTLGGSSKCTLKVDAKARTVVFSATKLNIPAAGLSESALVRVGFSGFSQGSALVLAKTARKTSVKCTY